ncbi:MAG TPA: TdeIII family type II restriction endonuclease [Candidatus Marinimicrobia bacterium]|nr:TdeIII family type II restriction endonuclease [Candidatus Neomarinimicrobiota bacterium]
MLTSLILLYNCRTRVKVADELWNFLGNDSTYLELLDCFERVGIELRPEIDAYFEKFKNN